MLHLPLHDLTESYIQSVMQKPHQHIIHSLKYKGKIIIYGREGVGQETHVQVFPIC